MVHFYQWARMGANWQPLGYQFHALPTTGVPHNLKKVRVKDRLNLWITSDIINVMYKWDYRGLHTPVGHMIDQSKINYFHDMSLFLLWWCLWKGIHKTHGSDNHVNNIYPNLDSNEFYTSFANVGRKISDKFIKRSPEMKKSSVNIYIQIPIHIQ